MGGVKETKADRPSPARFDNMYKNLLAVKDQ